MNRKDYKPLVTIIRHTGDVAEYRIDRHELLNRITGLIGAQYTDVVNLRDGRVMIVDDKGYETRTIETSPGIFQLRPVRALKPVNEKATEMYHHVCVPGTTHQIVGDVAIVLDSAFA